MRLSELLNIMAASDRIRIIQGRYGNVEPQFNTDAKILYCGYLASIEYAGDIQAVLDQDPEVVRMAACPEARHKEFGERGLFPPYEPEVTRMYEFKDLTLFLYYDIYIESAGSANQMCQGDGENMAGAVRQQKGKENGLERECDLCS